jgi:NAD(P)H-hydrate epimerase
MLSFKDVSVLDTNSEYFGVSLETLMENAGWAVAAVVERDFGSGLRIAVLCGCGNNGGDGFVTARHLKERNDVDVMLARPPNFIKKQVAWSNYEKVQEISMLWRKGCLEGYDLLIDALLGVRTVGTPREPFGEIIQEMNASGIPIVSVDIPSGLGSEFMVKPRTTVTFHDLKEGMDKDNSGNIVVEAIGIPLEAETYCGPGDYAYYPIPGQMTHKGDNGRVLIVGGGPYTGAPCLAGLGCYRIGADLVRVAAPNAVASTIASYTPNLIVHPLGGQVLHPGDVPKVKGYLREVDALLIGSGLGRDPQTMEAVRLIIKACDLPIVVDADGFAALAGGNLDLLKGKKGIITPHPGEYMKLIGQELPEDIDMRVQKVKHLAARIGMTVLLKGALDIVSDGERVRFNKTGNAGMTVGGTGDVLAGICAGLLAKGMDPFMAARVAAYTGGAAGDLAFETHSYGLLATDMVDEVPRVLSRSLDRFL